MGNTIDKVKEEVKHSQKTDEDNAEKILQIMSVLMDSKLKEFQLTLIQSKGEDKTIPINTVLEFYRNTFVNASDKPSPQLEEVIESIFDLNLKNIIMPLAQTALNMVLGNTQIGEKTFRNYEVLILYNTIVRIDYIMYSFTVSSKGLSDRVRNCFCVMTMTSTIDINVVTIDVLSYVIGKAANRSLNYINSQHELANEFIVKFPEYNGYIFDSEINRKQLEICDLIEHYCIESYYYDTFTNLYNDVKITDKIKEKFKSCGSIIKPDEIKRCYKIIEASNSIKDYVGKIKINLSNQHTSGSELQNLLINQMIEIYDKLYILNGKIHNNKTIDNNDNKTSNNNDNNKVIDNNDN